MRIGHGDPGPLRDAGGDISVLCVEWNVDDPEPVNGRPGRSGPIPARFYPDGGGHGDADCPGARPKLGRLQDVADHVMVFAVRWVPESLDRLVIQQHEPVHAAPFWPAWVRFCSWAVYSRASAHTNTSWGSACGCRRLISAADRRSRSGCCASGLPSISAKAMARSARDGRASGYFSK